MNIDPAIWGPNLWRSLHSITFAYPNNPTNNIKQSTLSFFSTLGQLLPCEKCRLNYSQHLRTHPLTDHVLSSRDLLMNWLIDIHNEINMLLGKPVISREHAKELIEQNNQQTNLFIDNTYTKMITILIIIIVIIVLFIVLWYKKTNLSRQFL